MSTNPAMAAIGQEVSIGGRSLVIESLLAEGGFASVYLATNRPELVAVGGSGGRTEHFVLKKMFAGGPEAVAQLTAEVRLMERLKHPNIVRVYGTDMKRTGGDGVDIYVLMEFCPGGTLLSSINKVAEGAAPPLSLTRLLETLVSIVRPVAYLHSLSPPIAHRDLKFENVLIAADGTLRLCDFGSCSTHAGPADDRADRAAQEDAIARFTTPAFRSPEMVDLYSGSPLDTRVDVWALGCLAYG